MQLCQPCMHMSALHADVGLACMSALQTKTGRERIFSSLSYAGAPSAEMPNPNSSPRSPKHNSQPGYNVRPSNPFIHSTHHTLQWSMGMYPLHRTTQTMFLKRSCSFAGMLRCDRIWALGCSSVDPPTDKGRDFLMWPGPGSCVLWPGSIDRQHVAS